MGKGSTMKGLLVMAALLLILVLAGCGLSQTATSKQHKNGNGEKVSNIHKKEKSSQSAKEGHSTNKTKTTKDQHKQKSKKKQSDTKNGNDTATHLPKPQYILGKNQYVKPIGNANPKVVLLTIDDAPAEHAVQMAETLKKLHAKAIFFVIGNLIDSNKGKEKLKKLSQMGFPVGDHTQTHPNLPDIPVAKQKTEIMSVFNKINQLLGKPPKFFRAPYGQTTNMSEKLASQHRMLEMNWSYGYDWNKQYENPQSLTKIMVNSPYLANGAILLMHDRDWSVKALPNIVKGLRAKGYQILNPALLKTP